MNLDFDTIEIPEEKLNRTIQNNIKKVHGIHRKQMIRHTAGLFCAAAFFFCLSAIFLHSNPSLAADLLHLFEKIENKQIFSGDLHTHATPLTNNNSQKSDGFYLWNCAKDAGAGRRAFADYIGIIPSWIHAGKKKETDACGE